MKHLIAWTLAAIVLLAPAHAADEPTGTQMLIDALVQVEEVESFLIDRIPPRFVLTWKENPSDYRDRTPVSADEHRARLQGYQPLLKGLIEASQAELGSFDVNMIPEHHRPLMLVRERRYGFRLLLADAEQRAIDGESEVAADRYAAACRLIELSFREKSMGGFIVRERDPLSAHMLAESMIGELRQSLCLSLPHFDGPDRDRLARSVSELNGHRAGSEPMLPVKYTYVFLNLVGHRETLRLGVWFDAMGEVWGSVTGWYVDREPIYLEVLPSELREVVYTTPWVQRQAMTGIGHMHKSVSLDRDPVESMHRYAHAAIRGAEGEFGMLVEQNATLLLLLCRKWFGMTDDLAAMQHLLAGSPPLEVEPESTAVTFSGLMGAFRDELGGAERGQIESSKRAAELAGMLLDYMKSRGAESIDAVERESLLKDFGDLRPDDPLRFEENMRRSAELSYIEMCGRIERDWSTSAGFEEHAPAWFESRGVPDAANGVRDVLKSIMAEENFADRLRQLSRGWLIHEYHELSHGETRCLRFMVEDEPDNWVDEGLTDYLLETNGAFAAYLRLDWFEDLAEVHRGTRALWELRDLLEAK